MNRRLARPAAALSATVALLALASSWSPPSAEPGPGAGDIRSAAGRFSPEVRGAARDLVVADVIAGRTDLLWGGALFARLNELPPSTSAADTLAIAARLLPGFVPDGPYGEAEAGCLQLILRAGGLARAADPGDTGEDARRLLGRFLQARAGGLAAVPVVGDGELADLLSRAEDLVSRARESAERSAGMPAAVVRQDTPAAGLRQ